MRSLRRNSNITVIVGTYVGERWPSSYKNGAYVYDPPRPDYRHHLVKRVTEIKEHSDQWAASRGYKETVYQVVTSEELIAADLTNKNAMSCVRHEQAKELKAAGYGGPLGSGEARALKGLFTELGRPELIKRGWALVETEVWVKPTPRQLRRHAMWGSGPAPVAVKRSGEKLQNCYMFKSPIEGIHFSKFIRLARMYRDDSKKLRSAVVALLANPDAAKEIEALDAVELLAGMQGLN